MSVLPLADCACLLGIHPKTLRQWLKQDALKPSTHPKDARIKCLTLSQVHHLADLHGRQLPLEIKTTPVVPQAEQPVVSTGGQTSLCTPSEQTSVLTKLACLETRVVALTEHVAQLALALVQERERSLEQRLVALESLVPQSLGKPMPTHQPAPSIAPEQVLVPLAPRSLIAAEQAARSRMPPLIEYSAQGCYVMVSSREGELHLEPDSPAWFDWLATISSFRFIGQSGRFSAYRTSDAGQYTRSWAARRWVHGHDFWHYLGVTDNLTLPLLEQAAAALQARVDAL